MTIREALLISNVAFLALVALAFVASTIVFFLNRASERAKDRELVAYHTAAQVRINAARADAATALERAIAGEKENLRTRERTVRLAHQALTLHARATDAGTSPAPAVRPLGDNSADRTLTGDQRTRMTTVLTQTPGQITVISGVGAETERYAASLRAIFNASGWLVETGVVIEPKLPLGPVSLVLGKSEQDRAVRNAFQAAGVAVTDRPRGPLDRPTTIYVGPHRPFGME